MTKDSLTDNQKALISIHVLGLHRRQCGIYELNQGDGGIQVGVSNRQSHKAVAVVSNREDAIRLKELISDYLDSLYSNMIKTTVEDNGFTTISNVCDVDMLVGFRISGQLTNAIYVPARRSVSVYNALPWQTFEVVHANEYTVARADGGAVTGGES